MALMSSTDPSSTANLPNSHNMQVEQTHLWYADHILARLICFQQEGLINQLYQSAPVSDVAISVILEGLKTLANVCLLDLVFILTSL